MAIETLEYSGHTIEIEYDQDAFSPRDDMTHGCEIVMAHSRYNFPNDADIDFDAFNSWEEIASYLEERTDVLAVTPIYAYEHGQIAFTTGPRIGQFADPWDSAQAGRAFVTTKNWEETQGTPFVSTPENEQRLAELMKSDVETYEAYVNGQIFYYSTQKNGEVVDSCAGFFSIEDAIEAAKENI